MLDEFKLIIKNYITKYKLLNNLISHILRKLKINIKRLTIKISIEQIDINNTQAFSYYPELTKFGSIWLNNKLLKNMDFFINDLRNESCIEKIYLKNDLYYGNFLKNFPDMIIKTKYIVSNDISPNVYSQEKVHHTMDGIILVKSPFIKKSININNVKIIDITPTILNILNIPVPNDVDGKPIDIIYKKLK